MTITTCSHRYFFFDIRSLPIQVKDWKGGHKKACRIPTEFKANDVVMAGNHAVLPNVHRDISGIFFVIGPAATEGSWTAAWIEDPAILMELSAVSNAMYLVVAAEERTDLSGGRCTAPR